MLETSARLLRLLGLLQGRRYWPGAELARRLDVSARTIRRDVDRLRLLGYPIDATGGLLLLEEQDRSTWDEAHMQRGAEWLQRSASGDELSRWHAEAGIAAAHCLASSFAQTPWQEIADLYALLEARAPSPLHTLNRAVAVAEAQGADAGLAVLAGLTPPSWLAGSYLWDSVLADLHRRALRPGAATHGSKRGHRQAAQQESLVDHACLLESCAH